MTTKQDIKEWLGNAPAGSSHMLVATDTFSWEDYPVYVKKGEDVRAEVSKRDGANMQKIMEVYNLSKPLDAQLKEQRSWNL